MQFKFQTSKRFKDPNKLFKFDCMMVVVKAHHRDINELNNSRILFLIHPGGAVAGVRLKVLVQDSHLASCLALFAWRDIRHSSVYEGHFQDLQAPVHFLAPWLQPSPQQQQQELPFLPLYGQEQRMLSTSNPPPKLPCLPLKGFQNTGNLS